MKKKSFADISLSDEAIDRIDPDALTATWLADLPSAGDTAFAGAVATTDGQGHLVFNYSSPTDRRWWPWMVGQLRPTHVSSVEIRFSEEATKEPSSSSLTTTSADESSGS